MKQSLQDGRPLWPAHVHLAAAPRAFGHRAGVFFNVTFTRKYRIKIDTDTLNFGILE
jgi:hypothetical protein